MAATKKSKQQAQERKMIKEEVKDRKKYKKELDPKAVNELKDQFEEHRKLPINPSNGYPEGSEWSPCDTEDAEGIKKGQQVNLHGTSARVASYGNQGSLDIPNPFTAISTERLNQAKRCIIAGRSLLRTIFTFHAYTAEEAFGNNGVAVLAPNYVHGDTVDDARSELAALFAEIGKIEANDEKKPIIPQAVYDLVEMAKQILNGH